MKHARKYEKKIRQLLSGLGEAPVAEDDRDPVEVMSWAILEADASRARAEKAFASLREEFVDLNEVRAAQAKEIVECIGKDYPRAHERAVMLTGALGNIFERTCNVSLRYLADMPKRQQRRHLVELGLSPYAEAAVALVSFGTHAIPVDETLVECLEMDRCVPPECGVKDVQGFLERVIAQRNALAAHEFFRTRVEASAKALDKRRKARAKKAAAEAARAEKEKTRPKRRPKVAPKTRAQSKAARKPAAGKAVKKAVRKAVRKESRRAGRGKSGKQSPAGAAARAGQAEAKPPAAKSPGG